jgi:P-type conjugative transfer protein TrbJ
MKRTNCIKTKSVKKIFIAIALCTQIILPGLSFGLIVYDPTVHGTMVANFAQEIVQLGIQAHSLISEIESIKNFNLNNGNAQANQELDAIASQLQEVTNIQDQFKNRFPGYDKYPTSDTQGYVDRYKNIIDNTQAVLSKVTEQMGYVNDPSRISQERQDIAATKADINSAAGTKAAVQGLAELNAQTISQLQLLRQQLAAEASAQNAYYAAQIQKEANADAVLNKAIDKSYKDINGKLDNDPIDINF